MPRIFMEYFTLNDRSKKMGVYKEKSSVKFLRKIKYLIAMQNWTLTRSRGVIVNTGTWLSVFKEFITNIFSVSVVFLDAVIIVSTTVKVWKDIIVEVCQVRNGSVFSQVVVPLKKPALRLPWINEFVFQIITTKIVNSIRSIEWKETNNAGIKFATDIQEYAYYNSTGKKSLTLLLLTECNELHFVCINRFRKNSCWTYCSQDLVEIEQHPAVLGQQYTDMVEHHRMVVMASLLHLLTSLYRGKMLDLDFPQEKKCLTKYPFRNY